jgi:hypothetical protein
MAILRPAEPDAPLQQGDLLDDVLTATTDGEGPTCSKPGMVLVVSRNCQAIRARHIIVARVIKRPLEGLKERATSLEDLVRFLEMVRDGEGTPDTFYLGELAADSADRYVAKFDQLFTITVPEDPEQRAAYLATHRRFSLTPDFAHDLHQRLFRAFASMGFDDEAWAWFSDADLKLVVEHGRSLLSEVEAGMTKANSRLQVVLTSGGNKREEKELRKTLEEAELKAKKLRKDLAPLEAELRKRTEGEAT